ncbi:MAG: NADH-quinone oxidoreductase subunit N [Planctomycetota bacterium]
MIALVVTMLAIVACPLFIGRNTRVTMAVASIGVLAAFLLTWQVAQRVATGGVSGLSPGNTTGILIADNLSAWFQILLMTFLGGVMLLWWLGSASEERNAPEFLILLLGSAVGMILMTSTTNLLMIIVAIETASLPSYAIVGFDKRDRFAAEASLKYMIFGAISAAIMLYGASLLYGLVGSLGAADIARYTIDHIADPQNRLILGLGMLCFLAGIAFKISAVPFHFWCPDAFEGAKIEVTMWLSVASKAAGLLLLTRLVLTFCNAVSQPAEMALLSPLAWTIGIMAAITCTVGNFSAYKQQSVKRLLAYSSIAHAGYMLMAAAVFIHPSASDSRSALSALLAYVLIYLFMNLGAFSVAAMVIWETGSDKIDSFTGLFRRAPWLAVPMVFCLVSLIGVPPFAGFIGKWWVLVALGNLSTPLGWILVIVAVVNTLISVYYYMRLIVQMAFKDDASRPPLSVSIPGTGLVYISAIALLVLFVWANPLKKTTDRFSENLYRPTPSAQQVTGSVASFDAGNR